VLRRLDEVRCCCSCCCGWEEELKGAGWGSVANAGNSIMLSSSVRSAITWALR
jgi:hypothetical protein